MRWRSDDQARYAALAEEIRTAFNAKPSIPRRQLQRPTQANQSFALFLGLVPAASQPAALDWLASDVRTTAGPDHGDFRHAAPCSPP